MGSRTTFGGPGVSSTPTGPGENWVIGSPASAPPGGVAFPRSGDLSGGSNCSSRLLQSLQYRNYVGKVPNNVSAASPWVLSESPRAGYFWWVLYVTGAPATFNASANGAVNIGLYLLPPGGPRPDEAKLVAGTLDPFFGDSVSHGPIKSGIKISPGSPGAGGGSANSGSGLGAPLGALSTGFAVPDGWNLLCLFEILNSAAGLPALELRIAFVELPYGSEIPLIG